MKKPSPDLIKEVLFSNAEDLGEAGIDTQTGHGRLTTDFIDTGRIIPDRVTTDKTSAENRNGTPCLGIMTGLAVGAMIWVVLIILIMIGK